MTSSTVFHKKYHILFIALFVLAILTGLSTILNRREHFDDAWFGELAYFLAQDGVIRSNLFSGMFGWGERVLMTHKLWVVATAIWIKIWDFSLFTVKTVNLPFVVFQIILFRCYSKNIWILTSLLFVTSGVVVRYTFVSRPEIAMASFGFLSWLALQKYHHKPGKHWLIIAASCSGITAVFHLQGALFMSAGAVWLIWYRYYREFIFYSLISFITFLLYFTDVIFFNAWEEFFLQISNDPATTALRNISEKLWNILKIPQIMLHSLGEIPATLLMLGCIFLRYKNKLKMSDLEKYMMILFFCFVVLINRVTHQYVILMIPFMVTFCAETLSRAHIFENFHWINNKKKFIIILFLIHITSGFIYDVKLIARNINEESLYSRNQRLEHIIGKDVRNLIAPISFIFDNIKNKFIIGQAFYYHYETIHSKPLTIEKYFNDAMQQEVEVIIFENNSVTMEYEAPRNLPNRLYGYYMVYKDNRYRIFRIDKLKEKNR